jgi:predicted aspartyl protease
MTLKMRLLFFIIFLIGLSSTESNAVIGSASVAMPRNQDRFFIIEVIINKKHSARLIVDTGASETILTNWLAKDINLVSSKSNEASADASGKPFPVFRAKVTIFAIGSHSRNNLSLPVVNIPSFKKEDGIAGLFSPQSFFAGMPILIDFPNAKLRWGDDADISKKRTLASINVQPCLRHRSSPLINLNINGVPGKFLIDTGGFKSVLTNAFAKKLGTLSKKTSSRTGISGKRKVESVQNLKVELQSISSFLSADIEEKANGCPEADGKLGIDWISNYGLFISSDRKNISLVN